MYIIDDNLIPYKTEVKTNLLEKIDDFGLGFTR
jgi:hypothetical protein